MEFNLPFNILNALNSLVKRISFFNDKCFRLLPEKEKTQISRIVRYAKNNRIKIQRNSSYKERWYGSFTLLTKDGWTTYHFVIGNYDYGKNSVFFYQEDKSLD